MEFASKLRWAIVITIVLLALVLIGWGLFSIASNVFRGGSSEEGLDTFDSSATFEPTSARSVSFTVDGPVTANQEHRSYTIEVNRNLVTMRVFSSYGQIVTEQKSYTNTDESYDTFLKALEFAGATTRFKGTTVEDDYAEQGVCASGVRYILEFEDDVRRWGTSCGAKQGTAGVTLRKSVFILFQKQVPDFGRLRSGTGI